MSYIKEEAGSGTRDNDGLEPVKQVDKVTQQSLQVLRQLHRELNLSSITKCVGCLSLYLLCFNVIVSFVRCLRGRGVMTCLLTCLRGRSLVSFFRQMTPRLCFWRHMTALSKKQQKRRFVCTVRGKRVLCPHR